MSPSMVVTMPYPPSQGAEQPAKRLAPCLRVGKVIPCLEGRSGGASRRKRMETDTPARVLDCWRVSFGHAQPTPSASKRSADRVSSYATGPIGFRNCLASAGFETGNPRARSGTSSSPSERAESRASCPPPAVAVSVLVDHAASSSGWCDGTQPGTGTPLGRTGVDWLKRFSPPRSV